jgi:hypothetical protein
MGRKPKTPLIDADGEVRRLPTPEEERWMVRGADFGDFDGVRKFLQERADFLKAAAALGLEPEAFLAFDPSKPGFIQRATAALEAAAKAGRMHAAE